MTTLEHSEPPSVDPTPAAASHGADAGPLAAVVADHQRMVWRYLRLLGADAHEADDLMQDTFVGYAKSHREGRPVATLDAFLRGIARNLLIAARRKSNRRGLAADWTAAVDAFAENQPSAFADERIDALRGCLEHLPGRARQAVEWHHVDGLSSRETGDRLGLGDEGIKSLLARTRDSLRSCVQRRLQGEEP